MFNKRILRVENLSFAYGNHFILQDINLEVYQGDFLAIVGPNGGGKSTLIKCILGFLKPFKGRIYLWERSLKEFKDWQKIGYVPQRAGDLIDVLTPLTVKEFLMLPSKWYDYPVNLTFFNSLLELFGLVNLLDKKLHELSYGQLQRAYIVRALILKPQLLILDEPSVGLDFISQDTFYKLLGDLNDQGITILLVTHETWLLTKKIKQVACLNQKLFFHGKHEEFCIFAQKEEFYTEYHRVEHTHW